MLSNVLSTVWTFVCLSVAVHAQYYSLTGVQTGQGQNGTRALRRNIYDVQNDQPAFFLYIQGLARMQNASQTDVTSWQQVAGQYAIMLKESSDGSGIHGRPYIPWNNVPNTPGAPQIGYCTHSSPLFATWHRPYLALIEQVLARHIQDIVKQYPPSQLPTYQAAADNFRLPYWDWASHPDLPPVATSPSLQIISPSGPITIRNPLYSYRFPTLDRSQYPTAQDSGLSTYPETARNPVGTVNSRLRAEGFQRRTWQSIARSRNFNMFSTSATPGTSIEAIHNSVHGHINAHMGSIAYSAFDPIFWLHHTNVDRLTALYQCINPNNWLTPMLEPQGTFTIRQFQLVGGTTPLTPFTSTTTGTLYTSDTSRYLTPFGYSYPEITDWNQTTVQLQASCTAHVNRLYNPNNLFFRHRKHKRSIRRSLPRIRQITEALSFSSIPPDVSETKQLRTWTVSVKVSKFDRPSPFVIRAFIGEPASNPQDWFKDKTHVGSLFVSQPGVGAAGSDAGGVEWKDVVLHDEFDIEEGLWERGLDGQDIEATKAFLGRELVWKVQTPEGKVIPLEQIKSLKVSVAEEMVTLARSITELPTYKNRALHADITKGKLGGFQGTTTG